MGHGIVDAVAGKLREQRLIPAKEVNDSYILAEAALAALLVEAPMLLFSPPSARVPALSVPTFWACSEIGVAFAVVPERVSQRSPLGICQKQSRSLS